MGEKRNCIKCGKEINEIHPTPNSNAEQGMWYGGLVAKISGNYGSMWDGDNFYITICDSCIQDSSIEYINNDYFDN